MKWFAWSASSAFASTATKLAIARSVYGNSFNCSADVEGVIASTCRYR